MTKGQLKYSQKIARFFMNRYRSFKIKRADLSDSNTQKRLRALLSKTQYAFVITQSLSDTRTTYHNEHEDSRTGSNARYVQPIVEWNESDFRIWIGTLASSRKAAEIASNPNVTIAIGNDRAGANLIVHGTATIHTDQELRRKYWKPVWRLFFEQGPNDPNYIAICVEPTHLELMDLKGNVVPEPFGLRCLKLVRKNKGWSAVNA